MDDVVRKTVEDLWDREMIKELTYTYGRCIERQDAESMAQVFSQDGQVDFSSLGRACIADAKRFAHFSPAHGRCG